MLLEQAHMRESLRSCFLIPSPHPQPQQQANTFSHSHNPGMISIGAIFAPLYLAFIPLTSYITRPSTPASSTLVSSAVGLTLRLIPGLGPRPLSPTQQIPALAALYTFVAFGASGAFSAAGQAMGRAEGLDNNNPRKHVGALDGMPARLRAAHLNLMENFPGWAVAASLTMAMGRGGDRQLVDLLGLHVLLKVVGE